MERFYELFRENEMQMRSKTHPAHYFTELAVVQRKWIDDEWHWRYVYLDVFDHNTGNKYIQERRALRTQDEKDHFVDWELRRLEIPHRMVWDVQYESLSSLDGAESEGIWFANERAANEYIGEKIYEREGAAETGCEYGYSVVHREMTDDQILDTFFDGDEYEFLKHVGCIPQHYDRLVCPMGNIPQIPYTPPLFEKEK